MSAYTDSRSERLKSRWSTVDSFWSNQLRMQSATPQQQPAPPQHHQYIGMQSLDEFILLHVSCGLFTEPWAHTSTAAAGLPCRQDSVWSDRH